MKKVPLYILIAFIALGCHKKKPQPLSKPSISEVQKYYNTSKNKKLAHFTRVNAINDAYYISKELKLDSLSLKILDYKASLMINAKKNKEYLNTSKQYLNLALKTNNTKAEGNAYFKIGYYYFETNKSDSAYYYFNKSKLVFNELNDSLSIARRLLNMAIIQSNESDFYGSEQTAVEALKYLKKSNKKQLLSVYNCLAITTSALKNYNGALYWTEKCEANQNDHYKNSILQNNKAGYLIDIMEYDQAENILTTLLEDDKIKNYNKLIANSKSNLGYIYLKQDKKKEALKLLNESLNIRKENNYNYETIESFRRLSEFYEGSSDYINARKYADSAYISALKTPNLNEKVATLKRKLNFVKENNYKALFQQYISWNDSLQTKNILNRDLFAKIKYDTEKTRTENLILNTKIARDSLKIAQETYRRNLGIFISSLLIISVLFIVFSWRQRIKIASFNATTKTENRISKKVHDEMANDLSNIKTLVSKHISNNNPIKDKLLTMLNITYTSARDIATETGGIIFGNSFGEVLKNLLMQHSNESVKIITSLSALDQLNIDEIKKNAIYRTLQELMVNMNKHSSATRVVIAHKKDSKLNEIKYSDNGVGAEMINLNNGLKNATNRMKDIGGSFSFETTKGKGFKALMKFKA